jgi:hypothetical protein
MIFGASGAALREIILAIVILLVFGLRVRG